jgi:hypothetical protein
LAAWCSAVSHYTGLAALGADAEFQHCSPCVGRHRPNRMAQRNSTISLHYANSEAFIADAGYLQD